jgi:hypothetical protein
MVMKTKQQVFAALAPQLRKISSTVLEVQVSVVQFTPQAGATRRSSGKIMRKGSQLARCAAAKLTEF